MKRSEMIILISNWLLTNAPETYQAQSSYGRHIDAESLLVKLELAGINPPINESRKREAESGLAYIPVEVVISNLLGWEPEDETN